MTLTYVCTLPLPDAWFDELRTRAPDVEVHRVTTGEVPAADLMARADMLHTGYWFPAASTAPRLRAIQLDTSGVDHVRGTDLWDTTVPIATLGGIAPVPMAEYTLMAILELAHRVPDIQRLRAERSWPSDAQRLATLTPRQLAGSTVTVIGYGRIGREIARLANAFGMHVIGVSRTGVPASRGNRFDSVRSSGNDSTEVLPMDRLRDALTRSDIVVVVVPLTEVTRGMLGAAELDLLPAGAFVIDIARGGIVDEQALLERLHDGRLGGVAMDVFDDEPLSPESPWWSEPRAVITPHVAGLAPQYEAQTLDLVVENLTRLAQGRPILNEVNRASGY